MWHEASQMLPRHKRCAQKVSLGSCGWRSSEKKKKNVPFSREVKLPTLFRAGSRFDEGKHLQRIEVDKSYFGGHCVAEPLLLNLRGRIGSMAVGDRFSRLLEWAAEDGEEQELELCDDFFPVSGRRRRSWWEQEAELSLNKLREESLSRFLTKQVQEEESLESGPKPQILAL
ncbi:unnamed protein product [Polarella glacialis]|uniref:Uncharacterized protein n=1 Tax=Polarella glacialis TaxID=89957 RepID=A0A813LF30_POLGL|nr:unnamed protein product [Polarella glacialis]